MRQVGKLEFSTLFLGELGTQTHGGLGVGTDTGSI